jgi:hypothetical protein
MRSKLKGLSLIVLLGGRYRDRVYADSFGNLVVYSPSGYKRIVVGEGHMARRMGAHRSGPDVVYLDEADRVPFYRGCPAVLLKGRSYMYGLPDHVVPEPSRDFCR